MPKSGNRVLKPLLQKGEILMENTFFSTLFFQLLEELYKKKIHDPDNQDGVTTHLEPDILECKVKWALDRITTNKDSGGDGIQVRYDT